MNLRKLVKRVVAIADDVTTKGDLQVTVQHFAWIGGDPLYKKPIYDTAIPRLALVEQRQRMRRMPDGREILQRAIVTFLRPITPNGASQRREPVDPRDKIILPNGYTGPILNVEGLENNSANTPYFLEVTLG